MSCTHACGFIGLVQPWGIWFSLSSSWLHFAYLRGISVQISPQIEILKFIVWLEASYYFLLQGASNPAMHIRFLVLGNLVSYLHFISREHLIFKFIYIKFLLHIKSASSIWDVLTFHVSPFLSGLEQGQSSLQNLCLSSRHPRQCTLDITCCWTVWNPCWSSKWTYITHVLAR